MHRREILLVVAAVALVTACKGKGGPRPAPGKDARSRAPVAPQPARPAMPWDSGGPLDAGQTFVLGPKGGKRDSVEAARAANHLVVDLSDAWVPYIFSESDPANPEVKPNGYRQTFVTLANNRATPDELFLESTEGQRAVLAAAGVPRGRKADVDDPLSTGQKRALDAARKVMTGGRALSFLEPFGIPPTLSVLRGRLQEDAARECWDTLDGAALASFGDTVSYLSREQARRPLVEAQNDAKWVAVNGLTPGPDGGTTLPDATAPAATDSGAVLKDPTDPKVARRIERWRRGQERLRAVGAVQARLVCEGLLSPKSKYVEGMFDLPTHEALALWERKNDVFGWGFIGEETTEALRKPWAVLHLETFRRVLAERVADAAGIIEDGSVSRGRRPAHYKDSDGATHPVPDLIAQHVDAVMKAMRIETPEDLADFFAKIPVEVLAGLSVAIAAPALPPYYAPTMQLSIEIDRGDIWYDFPWDAEGKPIEQRRERFPHLQLLAHWNGQRIPLARWRTTIGSWRSELHPGGRVYYKYKNSDVGPRIWKNVVAAPVWIPPDGTPGKDLLTKKVFDRNVGPVTVVDTDVMGPGFQSAYGLALAIHHKVTAGGGLFDNQIRTHGSVDYTSIARRFSHGCHRLVNNRAVRLYDFVLRRRPFKRIGDMRLGGMKRRFEADGKEYRFALPTRGYYYELTPPLPVMVTEGRVMGKVAKPMTRFVRKPGVDYGPPDAPQASDEAPPEPALESATVVNP